MRYGHSSRPKKKSVALTDSQRRIATATAAATALAGPCEGLRQYAYRDVTGLPTICMGSTKGVKMTDFRTIPECNAMLTVEMRAKVEAVEKCHPGLPVSVLAAMSDAAYNLGEGVICDRSHTVAQYLYKGDFLQGCNALPLYDKARVAGVLVALPGLTKRRGLERGICLRDIS